MVHIDTNPGGVLPYICLVGMCRPKGNTEVHKRINLSFQFQMNKKERVICKFQMDFKKSFCWRSNLSNNNIISAYARSDNGNGFLEARSKIRCGK